MLAAVTDPSQIAQARRAASDFARAAGFGESELGRIAIVATEMATNLLKHGGGGEIVIGSYDDHDGAGMELIALDKGRGIADIARALEDGYLHRRQPGQRIGSHPPAGGRFRRLVSRRPRRGGDGPLRPRARHGSGDDGRCRRAVARRNANRRWLGVPRGEEWSRPC